MDDHVFEIVELSDKMTHASNPSLRCDGKPLGESHLDRLAAVAKIDSEPLAARSKGPNHVAKCMKERAVNQQNDFVIAASRERVCFYLFVLYD